MASDQSQGSGARRASPSVEERLQRVRYWLLMFRIIFVLIGFFTGAIVTVGMGIMGIVDSRAETSPTVINIADFPRQYHGQKWLQINGKLDLANAAAVTEHHKDADYLTTYIAVIDPKGSDGNPVHVIVEYTPWASDDNDPVPQADPQTVAGCWMDPVPQARQQFPGAAEPLVFIHAGRKPMSIGKCIGLMGFGVGLFLLGVFLLRWVLRRRRKMLGK